MSETASWYASLVKPSWAPPAEVFGPVWALLYVLITISFGYVFWQAGKGRLPKTVALPFALNLVVNLIYSPLHLLGRLRSLVA